MPGSLTPSAVPGRAAAIRLHLDQLLQGYDGKWVLTTNMDLPPREVAPKYKQLWMVEDVFRSMKSLLDTRPVFHQGDETIRGHVFCSFLALLLRKELEDRLARKEWKLEWADVVRDLDNIVEMEVAISGKGYVFRGQTSGVAGKVWPSSVLHPLQGAGSTLPTTVGLRHAALPIDRPIFPRCSPVVMVWSCRSTSSRRRSRRWRRRPILSSESCRRYIPRRCRVAASAWRTPARSEVAVEMGERGDSVRSFRPANNRGESASRQECQRQNGFRSHVSGRFHDGAVVGRIRLVRVAAHRPLPFSQKLQRRLQF